MGCEAKVGQPGLTNENQHKHEQNLWVTGGGTNIYMYIWVTHFKTTGHTHTWDLKEDAFRVIFGRLPPVRSLWDKKSG